MTTAPTPRTRLRRHAERGVHEREQIDAILDATFLCHVGVVDDGVPCVLPMIYGRWQDRLVLHGAPANALLRSGSGTDGGVDPSVCVTVTVVDEIVMARSALHHSLNYRSVVVYGRAEEITDPAEKLGALAAVVDHGLPGRSAEARPPTPAELRATRVVAVRLDEASAKVRTGPPAEDPADEGLAVWSGTVPLTVSAGRPVPAPDRTAGVDDPPAVTVRGAGSG